MASLIASRKKVRGWLTLQGKILHIGVDEAAYSI